MSQLSDDHGAVTAALRLNVDGCFRPKQSNVRAAAYQRCHAVVRPAPVGKFDRQPVFGKVTEIIRDVKGCVKDRVRRFVQSDGSFVRFLLASDQAETPEKTKSKRQEQCDSFFQCNLLLLQFMYPQCVGVKKELIILNYKLKWR